MNALLANLNLVAIIQAADKHPTGAALLLAALAIICNRPKRAPAENTAKKASKKAPKKTAQKP